MDGSLSGQKVERSNKKETAVDVGVILKTEGAVQNVRMGSRSLVQLPLNADFFFLQINKNFPEIL
jgi:hypothetical protein